MKVVNCWNLQTIATPPRFNLFPKTSAVMKVFGTFKNNKHIFEMFCATYPIMLPFRNKSVLMIAVAFSSTVIFVLVVKKSCITFNSVIASFLVLEFNPIPTKYPYYTLQIQNLGLFSNLGHTLQKFLKGGHFQLADTLLLSRWCPLIGESNVHPRLSRAQLGLLKARAQSRKKGLQNSFWRKCNFIWYFSDVEPKEIVRKVSGFH